MSRPSHVVMALWLACVGLARTPAALAQDPIPLDPGSGGRSIGAGALVPGDLIVSTTDALISRLIQRATASPVSHAMIFAGDVRGEPSVIEAVAAGVRSVPLAEALEDASLAVAFRHPDADRQSVRRLLDYAGARVGNRYDSWGVAQQLLCRKAGVLCEVSTENHRWYCSELVLSAYQAARLPLSDGAPRWRAPGDLVRFQPSARLEYIGHLVAR